MRPARAEGVRLQDFRAGFDILLVRFANHAGRREIQLVVTAVDENALGIQHRAHGAIRHHHAILELIAEFLKARGG